MKIDGRIMEEMLIIMIGNSMSRKLKVTKKKSRANRNFAVFKSMLLGPFRGSVLAKQECATEMGSSVTPSNVG